MTHDPMCPWVRESWWDKSCVVCDLIRMVRKDENRKVNHLRRRIERLTDKANRWRDEAAELRKQLREKP